MWSTGVTYTVLYCIAKVLLLTLDLRYSEPRQFLQKAAYDAERKLKIKN